MADVTQYVDTSQKIIVSDLLYFVSNKIRNTPVKDIVTSCYNFYADDDYVFNEKKLFCDATGELCTARRNDKKCQAQAKALTCRIFAELSLFEIKIPFAPTHVVKNVTFEGKPSSIMDCSIVSL